MNRPSGPESRPEESARDKGGLGAWRDPVVRRTLKIVLVIIGAGLVFWGLYRLVHLLILLFVATLVAAAMYVPVAFLERRGLPRIVAVVIPYLVLAGLLVLLGFFIIPPLIGQLSQFIQDLPSLLADLGDWVQRLGGPGISDTLRQEASQLAPDVQTILNIPFTILGIVFDSAVVFAASLMLLLERDGIRRWFLQFMARDTREAVDELSSKAFAKLGAYVRGQLLLMFIIGTGTAIGMLIFGVPFALPMGVVGFIGEAIPNFGPVTAGAPVVLLGLLESPGTGLIMLLWLIGLQGLESYVLTPIVQHGVMDIPPVVIFVAVVAGFSLFGVLGGIIAVPLVGVVDVIFRDVIIPLRRRELRREGKG